MERQGYYATSLAQIIEESGAPKGSMYYHFPGGKEQIAIECVRESTNVVVKRLSELDASDTPPGQAIQTFLNRMADNLEQVDFSTGSPLALVSAETALTNEPLSAVCKESFARIQAEFSRLLRQGGMDPIGAEQHSGIILAAIQGGLLLSRTNRETSVLRQVAAHLGETYTRIKSG